jgi:flagellar assembly protein FliH
MSVYKDKMGTIEFKVSDYQFEAFDTAVGSVNGAKDFEFINFDKNSPLTKPEHQKVIKAERGSATKNQFEIAPMVKEHRGLVEQENREREDRIEEEVKKRVDALNDMIYRVLEAEQEMLDSYKIEIYTLTRSLTKWVILRELNDDKDYLKRLLEKLIHEINSKSNLLIKVGVSQFKNMPEVLEQVEASLGKIKNTRLELDDTLDSKGLVIESDNGIINASLKQQFKGISKLFESLGVSQETESEAEIEAESEDEGDSDL